MASLSLPKTSFLLALLFFSSFTLIVHAIVPQNETFKFVNSGELGPFIVEYGGDYRMISIFNSPFQVGFYNTTPNAFTLALRVGLQRSEQLFRWVWEANRGNPVGENATFSLGTDGNLVLADADGRIVWQTNTSKRGVVAFRLLPNGNMVLLDAQGKFVWQSFDHPTDTLLVGQYLRAKGPSKLVSRLSEKENVDGPYSLVLEPKGLALYYKSKNSLGQFCIGFHLIGSPFNKAPWTMSPSLLIQRVLKLDLITSWPILPPVAIESSVGR
ncbi:hypothetical protein PHAVU_005G061160 [Phaseolus vulgaris]